MRTIEEIIKSYTRDETLKEYLFRTSQLSKLQNQLNTNNDVPRVIDYLAMAARILELEEELKRK